MNPHRRTETVGKSPKAIASGLAGLGIGVVLAILNVTVDANLLGDLPGALQVILLAAIPPIVTYLSAYQAPPGHVIETGTASSSDTV